MLHLQDRSDKILTIIRGNVNIIKESVQNMVSRDGGKGKNPYQALEINTFGFLLLFCCCLFVVYFPRWDHLENWEYNSIVERKLCQGDWRK